MYTPSASRCLRSAGRYLTISPILNLWGMDTTMRDQLFFSAGIGSCTAANAFRAPSMMLRIPRAFGLASRCAVVMVVVHAAPGLRDYGVGDQFKYDHSRVDADFQQLCQNR